MAWGYMPKGGGKRKPSFGQKLAGQQKLKAGGLPGPPVKNTKVARSVLNDQMPGERVKVPNNRTIHDAITQPLQWSAPKKNTAKGNARAGSMYREATDPKTGEKLHLYEEEAGGIPKEIVRVKKPKTFGQRLASRAK